MFDRFVAYGQPARMMLKRLLPASTSTARRIAAMAHLSQLNCAAEVIACAE